MFWNLYNFVIWNVDHVRIVFSLFYQLFPFFSFDGAWWIAMIMCVFMLHNFDWMFFFSDLELFENILVEQFLPVLGPPNPLPGHCLFRGLDSKGKCYNNVFFIGCFIEETPKKKRSGIIHIYIIVSYWLRIDKNIYIRLKSSKFYMLLKR